MGINIEKMQRNDDWYDANRDQLVADAPAWAVHAVIADGALVGYYGNWVEAYDAFASRDGAVIRDLEETELICGTAVLT